VVEPTWTATAGVDYTGGQNFNFQPFGYAIDNIANNDIDGSRVAQDRNQREITVDSKLNWGGNIIRFPSSFVLGVQGFFSKSAQPGAFNHNFPGPRHQRGVGRRRSGRV
jgi:hypothetical protein